MAFTSLSKKVPTLALSYSIIKIASFFKVSFIVGSSMAFFSATSFVTPLIGVFAGLWCNALLVIGHLSTWFLWGDFSSLHYLAYSIPGFCASAYWTSPYKFFFRCIMPVVCMVLFGIHAVGAHALPYTLYWLIPIVLYVVNAQSLGFQALGSTCVAHAVGSVIWLYTLPSTPAMWLGLIPIVALERLCYAAGMVILYRIVHATQVKLQSYRISLRSNRQTA